MPRLGRDTVNHENRASRGVHPEPYFRTKERVQCNDRKDLIS